MNKAIDIAKRIADFVLDNLPGYDVHWVGLDEQQIKLLFRRLTHHVDVIVSHDLTISVEPGTAACQASERGFTTKNEEAVREFLAEQLTNTTVKAVLFTKSVDK